MAFPVTLNGRTYTLADFEGLNYVSGFPDALEDFVTDAGGASTAATNAAASETAAAASATAAAASATAAQASLDAIEGLYLGAQASDPTVDLNGDALTAGDWYFNTSAGAVKIYDGSAWVTITSISFELVDDTTPQLGGNLDLNGNNVGGVTPTELGYVSGVTSAIQTQIDSIDPSPTLTATASGAISNGDTVIVNSDGTVSSVAGSTENVGSATAIAAAGPQYSLRQGAFDANTNKVVFAYRDGNNSSYGTAVVGTVSGTSISFGTPVVFESSASGACNVVYDPDTTKIVICYNPSSADGYGIVGTVSGTSISFGTRTQFETGAVNGNVNGICYDTTNNKVIYAYRDGGNSNYGTAVVGTVSGTSISFGTPVVFESTVTSHILPIFDTNAGSALFCYTDGGTDTTSKVGTVSGTSISFGSKVDIETASSNFLFGVYDSTAQKIMVFYTLNSGTGSNAKVATISGTSVSYGSATTLYAGYSYADYSSGAYDSNANRCVFTSRQVSPSDGYIVTAQISGTDVVNGTTAVAFPNNDLVDANATVFDSNANKIAVAFADNATGQNQRAYGFVYTAPSTNITSENYIGISNAAYSDTSTATIQLVGSVDDAQSGLTAGQSYYVQNDGSLGTTASTPSVFAGTAVSATKLIVKG